MFSLKNKVVVLTGAASGIGRATAEVLAQRGARLALVDVQQTALDSLVNALEKEGVAVSTHSADVGDRDRMMQLVEEILAIHGHVDVLINNAGVNVGALFEDHSLEDSEWLLQTNLMGVIYGCSVFLPHLRTRPEAHIVNLSSMFALFGMPGQAIYSASKSAIQGFTEALQCELRGSSVSLTSVHPGTIKSQLIAASRMFDQEAQDNAVQMQHRYGMPSERAAEKIVTAIEKRKRRLLIGADAHLADLLKRLMPVGFQRIVGWLF